MDDDDLELETLVEAISDVCVGYEISTVMAGTMVIGEAAVLEMYRAIKDGDIVLNKTLKIAQTMAAERLEYMAQLLRGNPAIDPHESLGAMQ